MEVRDSLDTQEKGIELSGKVMSLDFEHYFFCAYVLFSSLFVGIVSTYSLFSALIISPNLFLIPFILGRSILRIFNSNWLTKSVWSRFLLSFMVGCVFLHGFFVLNVLFFYLDYQCHIHDYSNAPVISNGTLS